MTVTSATSSVTTTGNGTTTAFPFPYRFLENAHLRVIRTVIASGAETELTLDSGGADGFTATGAGEPAGGTITVVTAPTALQTITIDRGNVPATQEQSYIPNTTLPAQTVEKGLDKLTMLVQQVMAGNVSRVLKLFLGDTDGSGRYNANGNRIADLGAAVDPTDAVQLQQVTALSAGSFIASGVGALTRTMQDKARDLVSVKDFGATGDGTTDDSVYVQAAFTAAAAAGADVVFPAGSYVVGGLTFAGKRMVGYGATLVLVDAAADAMLTTTADGAVVEGLKFSGNSANNTLNTAHIVLSGDYSKLLNCEITDFYGRVAALEGEGCIILGCYYHDTGFVANCNCIDMRNRACIVHDNRFFNIGDGHVVRVGYASIVRDCDAFIISNNHVKTTLHGTFTCELGANRGLIIGNTVDGADAAYKTETDATIYDITIIGNVVMNLTDTGSINLNSPGINYIGNRHYNLPNGGPSVGDLGRVEGNFFRDCGGMTVANTGDRVEFVNNTIIDPDVVLAGQVITPEGGCVVRGNRIVSTTSANLGIGIRVFGANNLIEGNVIEGLDKGVEFSGTCSTSIVKNNHVTDCPNQTTLPAGDGSNLVEDNYGFYTVSPTKTIAAGVITVGPLNRSIKLDTEGAAVTDDLDTINGGVNGQILVLRSESNARDPVAKDGTGNLGLVGDFTFASTGHRLVLECDGTNWFEISRSAP